MGSTVLDISMSLDGFVAGPNRTPEAPLGECGDLLHHLEAGLIEEVSIHLAPVLLGAGTSLFGLADVRAALESTEAIGTPAATHLRFRIAPETTAMPERHP